MNQNEQVDFLQPFAEGADSQGGVLRMDGIQMLDGLEPLCFQHFLDKNLLDKMKRVPGVPKAIGRLVDYVVKQEKVDLTSGGGFVVTNRSMPKLYKQYVSVCRTLNLPEPFPQLYLKGDASINAYTTGDDELIVCLNRGVNSFCSEGEQRFILGHEIGHCLCKHVVYHNAARFLVKGLEFGELFTTAVTAPLQVIRPLLMEWSRCSELSADRAGLLACQDLGVACSAFAKMGGHAFAESNDPEAALLEQARAYRKAFGEFGLFRRLVKSLGYAFTATHPFLPIRYEALKDWHDGGYFDELISASPDERKQIANEMSGDSQMHDLKNTILCETVDYLEEKQGIERDVSYPLLRKALFLKQTLRNTELERLLRVELRVRRIQVKKMEYRLELTIFPPDHSSDSAIRTSIVLNCLQDGWACAPKQIRHEMVKSRTDEVVCCIYSC